MRESKVLNDYKEISNTMRHLMDELDNLFIDISQETKEERSNRHVKQIKGINTFTS